MTCAKRHPGLGFKLDELTNGDHAEETDLGKDGLEMTSRVVVLSNKGGGSSEESVGTGRDDDTLSLTLLAGRSPERPRQHEHHISHRDEQ